MNFDVYVVAEGTAISSTLQFEISATGKIVVA